MMKTDDLENELRNLKFTHLTERELAAYCDQEVDQIGRDRVEAHVKQCFICERQLELLEEERAALSQRVITADDVAFVERVMEQTGLMPEPSAARQAESDKGIPFTERIAEYLQQMTASWRISFGQGALRGETAQGEEVWHWQSEDGKLHARALIEKNADLTINFSSNDMELDSVRLAIRLGKLSQDVTLERVSESEVAAQVAVPWEYRQSGISNISIEIVSAL